MVANGVSVVTCLETSQLKVACQYFNFSRNTQCKARIFKCFECIILELLVTASILVITRRMLHSYNLQAVVITFAVSHLFFNLDLSWRK